jgi:transposase
MKKSINDQLIEIYYFVDEFSKLHPEFAQWRESNNRAPRFSDAEVITIALMQGYFGCATLSQTYDLVRANASSAFPHLCSYKQWIARLQAVSPLIGLLVLVSSSRPGEELQLFRMDSKPIPVCHPLRHARVRLLREDGAYFSKSTKGWFFGFKLHSVVNQHGLIVGAILTPANTDDRDAAPALAWATEGGLCLADWGYRGEEVQDLLIEEADLLLLTTNAVGDKRALVCSLRERVETTFSQLWSRFVDRVFSRSWNGLWTTIKLKLLHLNLCLNGIIEA